VVIAEREADGQMLAEVAHEALLRAWPRLGGWLREERHFLTWKSSLETDRRAWQAAPENAKTDALLHGFKLAQARTWLATHAEQLSEDDQEFIGQSVKRRRAAQARRRLAQALVYVLLVGIIAGLVGWINQSYIQEQAIWLTMRPQVLSAEAERALKPESLFKECARQCPEMIVLPAGRFMMGSPDEEKDRFGDEDPRHEVTIAAPFAVSKTEVTFPEWDACIAAGACARVSDSAGWGRDGRPVINVSWDDAKQYVAWLSRMTGKAYRLLTEAEWEYAARAGSAARFAFGDDEGQLDRHAWYNRN
jgi:hypothetical protein